MINFEDFKALDIRIGKVISAKKVPNADKLVKIIFDLGTEERQIIAGIAEYFENLEELIGKEMPIHTNLAPKTFKGYESCGMILAADEDGKPVLLHPDQEVKPGTKVR